VEGCSPCHCPPTAVSSGSTVLALSHYVTIYMKLLLVACIDGIGQSACDFYIEHKFKGFCKLLYNMIDPI
jgi:hypothetical protein